MSQIVLPFSRETKADNHETGIADCELYKRLPPELQKQAESNLHLLEYLHMVPIGEVGMPEFHAELNRKMGENKNPNIIYPAGNGIFIHILADPKDNRHTYIPIEPTITQDLVALMAEVEGRCIDVSDRLAEFDTNGDKKKQLLDYIEQITVINDKTFTSTNDKDIKKPRKKSNVLTKVKVNQRELQGIKYLFLRDKMGLGTLEPLIVDPYIEDISCSGMGHVFVEHKIFKSLKSSIVFDTLEDLDEFVLRLAEQIRKPVTYKEPIADATLPDGSRINIVYGRDVSKRGSNFTIRKFNETPVSIFDLVDFGSLNYQMLAYLSLVIGNGMNLFVSGETASGKTTLLNAVTTFIHPLAKIITIEDTPELQVPHQNWIREVVQSTKTDDTSGAITMFDLLKAALRQRPNEIMVGEIRGAEGNIAFQAMQTGHSVMATFHAATTEKLIQRITNNPISVPKTYIDNLNVVVLTSSVKLPNGKTARRVTGISEIVSYDSSTESYNIVQAFTWDEATDTFHFTGYMSSYILEFRIAAKMGLAGAKKRRVYDELERRAKILQKLHKEQHITDFYEILEVLGKAQREGLF
ncbi:MAG: type II/IV secretion system ATPase subunit [Dehalococcoidales bacterium]|nr:type II/IV secretion system ATPase subunit [Dehalococcoidales bacterium]